MAFNAVIKKEKHLLNYNLVLWYHLKNRQISLTSPIQMSRLCVLYGILLDNKIWWTSVQTNITKNISEVCEDLLFGVHC